MALLVAKRGVSILHDEFDRHAAMPAIAQIVCASAVVNSAFVTIGLVLSRSSVVVRAQGLAPASPAPRVTSPDPSGRSRSVRLKPS
jgi:hypothetical protein